MFGQTLVLDSGEETRLNSGDMVLYRRGENTLSFYRADGHRILFKKASGEIDHKLYIITRELVWFLDGLCTCPNIKLSEPEKSRELITWHVL